MSRPLIACLLLLLSTGASAAHRKRVPVAAGTSAADKQSFEQTYLLVFLQAGHSFLDNGPMPDPSSLKYFIASLKEPELSSATAALHRLEERISDAEAVQEGSGGVPAEAYKLMVDHVAQSLEVGAIVEERFAPNNRAGRSLDASEKSLVAACQAEARDQGYDRRGYYRWCLGRRSAEAVYMDAAHLAQGSEPAPDPVRARLLGEVMADRSRFAPTLSKDLGAKMEQMRSQLVAGTAQPGADVPDTASVPWSGTGSIGRSLNRMASRTSGAGPSDFRQPPGLTVKAPPLNSADLAAGAKLAQIAARDEIGFTGYCYSYVKSALQKAGIVDRSEIDSADDGAHAKLFADFVDKNPGLLHRKLLRVPSPQWPLPIGTIVVWSAGACGYSAESGHIEIITRIKPPQACSDGCGTFQVACMEELAAAPAAAAAKLPSAQRDLQQAQADYESAVAAKNAAAKRAAAAALAKKKAALKAVQAGLHPRVAVYVIERPKTVAAATAAPSSKP
ncbi:MAG: hypothetical protein NTX64_01750 [Elusimicrobia bacterium]|nr:hypothetical protein [Elusimicrobiota bacterium]